MNVSGPINWWSLIHVVFWCGMLNADTEQPRVVLGPAVSRDIRVGPNMNAAGEDLRGSQFVGQDLSAAKFDGCNLAGVRIYQCDLTDASFRDARLTDATILSIPAEISGAKVIRFHAIGDDDAILEASSDETGVQNVSLWKVTADSSSKIADVRLDDFVSEVATPTMRALFSPSLVPLGFSYFEIAQSATYFRAEPTERVRKAVTSSFVLVAVLSLLPAAAVFYHERNVGRRGLQWAVFVFLFGLPGVFGYWFHRKWPGRISCPKCQTAQAVRGHTCHSCSNDMVTGLALATDILG
ncbi:MAG: pentapeptide repeat-containing protein [Planctomycetales bacterium]|nr:pentapeptide repeat-containing protein [Planctomycetales bacterium]